MSSLTVIGNAHSNIARLLPIKFDIIPYIRVPVIEPSDKTEPIQADISTLTGPESSGDRSDRSSGSDGDVQPTEQPQPRQPTLTRHVDCSICVCYILVLTLFGCNSYQLMRPVFGI